MQLAHYLFFTTTCAEALAYYTHIGLGRVVEDKRYDDGRIMHAKFEGAGIAFYASDNTDAEPMRGFAHYVLLDDDAATDRLFAALGDGGTVTTPLARQPWGYYGKLTDRFGVQWMIQTRA